MRLNLTISEVEAITAKHYRGASAPLSQIRAGERPDDCDWWRLPMKREQFNSERHAGALSLYLDLAKHCVTRIPKNTFPARFDISDANLVRPDKGFIKMCLNSEPALLLCSVDKGILLFQLTDAGRAHVSDRSP